MNSHAKKLIFLFGSIIAATSQAHFFAEAHDCKAPIKPLEFITELDRQEFEQAVANYRGCLQSFIDKQNAGMTKHQTAAQQASDTWSEYAQRVLGAKKQE